MNDWENDWERKLKERELLKSFAIETQLEFPFEEIIKARSGVYKLNKQNIRMGRAGERYGNAINGGQIYDLEGRKRYRKIVVEIDGGKRVTITGDMFQSGFVPDPHTNQLSIRRVLQKQGYKTKGYKVISKDPAKR